jgi:DNA ligase 4
VAQRGFDAIAGLLSTGYPAVRILRRWITELHNRFLPLSFSSTAIIFRLLFPEEDVRRKYDMQEDRLSQYLSECFGIQDQRLRGWRRYDSSGCLGKELKRHLNNVSAVHQLFLFLPN